MVFHLYFARVVTSLLSLVMLDLHDNLECCYPAHYLLLNSAHGKIGLKTAKTKYAVVDIVECGLSMAEMSQRFLPFFLESLVVGFLQAYEQIFRILLVFSIAVDQRTKERPVTNVMICSTYNIPGTIFLLLVAYRAAKKRLRWCY